LQSPQEIEATTPFGLTKEIPFSFTRLSFSCAFGGFTRREGVKNHRKSLISEVE